MTAAVLNRGRQALEKPLLFLQQLLERRAPLLRQHRTELRRLVAELESRDFELAVIGRMKTGKSTLINALLGRRLCICDVTEATATVNRISYGSEEATHSFCVEWQDQRPAEARLLADLSLWTGTSPEVEEQTRRTRTLLFIATSPLLKGLNLVDTPGTGSTSEVHQKVIESYLEGGEAAAMLHVFAFEGRESDAAQLGQFRQASRGQAIGVLHKWDHLEGPDPFARAQAKAADLHRQFPSLVEVLPVSAPLALAAKCLDPQQLEECRQLLLDLSPEALEEALDHERSWSLCPRRAAFWSKCKELSLGWASIRRLCQVLASIPPGQGAAEVLLRRSGLPRLEEELRRRFLEGGALRHQEAVLEDLIRLVRRVAMELEKALRASGDASLQSDILKLERDLDAAQKCLDQLALRLEARHLLTESDSPGSTWLRARLAEEATSPPSRLELAAAANFWKIHQNEAPRQQSPLCQLILDLIETELAPGTSP